MGKDLGLWREQEKVDIYKPLGFYLYLGPVVSKDLCECAPRKKMRKIQPHFDWHIFVHNGRQKRPATVIVVTHPRIFQGVLIKPYN